MHNDSKALIDLSSGSHTFLFAIIGLILVGLIARFFIVKPGTHLAQQLQTQDRWAVGANCFRRMLISLIGFICMVGLIIFDYFQAETASIWVLGLLAIILLVGTITNLIEYRLWKRG